jgi:putative Mg2+ transporter-C (MgtC) family protein
MTTSDFSIDLGTALLSGVLIGLERQYRQHPAGLRTNALVCVGAALFVLLDGLSGISEGTTRMAPYVVSGIGFLGGGVILRDGLNVKGVSTAATLWCTAAVGVLAGSGYPAHAMAATLTVLAIHVALRPISHRIDERMRASGEIETSYRLRVTCDASREHEVRDQIVREVGSLPKMILRGVSVQEDSRADRSTVVADVSSPSRDDRSMQGLTTRINAQPFVSSVRWDAMHPQGL